MSINLVVAAQSTLISGEILSTLAATRGIVGGASLGTQPGVLSGPPADAARVDAPASDDARLQHMRLIRGEFGQAVPYVVVQNIATFSVAVSRPSMLVQG